MLPSLADFDLSQLSEGARETFDLIARPISERDLEPGEIAEELGIERKEVQARLDALGSEMLELAGLHMLPPLSREEYEALRDSIAEHGQLVPILLDASGGIIDGHHRARACAELGIEPRTSELGSYPGEFASLGLVLNLARRQLSSGARIGLVESELMRDAARSDRSIAVALGVSPSTVGRVRRELEGRQKVSRLDTRVGRDGVAQPAAKPSRPAPEPAKRESTVGDCIVSLLVPAEFVDAFSSWYPCKAVRLVKRGAGYELVIRR